MSYILKEETAQEIRKKYKNGYISEKLGLSGPYVSLVLHRKRGIPKHVAYSFTKVIDSEKEIMRQELLNEGKPEDKIENILVGKVRKYYEEVCLENQIYVKAENKETVGKFLSNNNSKLVNMVRFEVGEGMEKRQEDFADEVMSQING